MYNYSKGHTWGAPSAFSILEGGRKKIENLSSGEYSWGDTIILYKVWVLWYCVTCREQVELLDCLFSSVQVWVQVRIQCVWYSKYSLWRGETCCSQLLLSAQGSCGPRCYYYVSDSDGAALDTLCSPRLECGIDGSGDVCFPQSLFLIGLRWYWESFLI